MKEQIRLQKLLLQKFEEIRAKNPAFSRRAFARKMGLSPGAISEIFNGQRRASLHMAEKIADRLLLDPQERAELYSLYPESLKERKSNQDAFKNDRPSYLQITTDQFQVIGDWYHFAILTLMRTLGFQSDPNWIASRLNISLNSARVALQRLLRVGLVTSDETGQLKRSEHHFRTTDDVANISVRKAHHQSLDNARSALETLPVEVRDFTALMMSINPKKITKAKEMIRKFQDELAKEMEVAPQTEVYQLSILLFPLTRQNEIESVRKTP